MGKEFQRRAKAMILRAAVLRNQIHVKVSKNALPFPGVYIFMNQHHSEVDVNINEGIWTELVS